MKRDIEPGRRRPPPPWALWCRARGMLNYVKAEQIRAMYAVGEGDIRQLARVFSVSKSLVGAVVKGRIWVSATLTGDDRQERVS